MKRLTFLLVIMALVVFTLLASSNRAGPVQSSELAQPVQTAQPCGCSTACMGGKKCAISCPTGRAAHCDCLGGSQTSPQEAKCYCR